MSVKDNFANLKPSLLLAFSDTKTLDPRITYARASTATFYDGKTVAKAEENLLLQSQTFDNAAWTKSATTVTANTTNAPDGTTTADSLIDTTDNARHVIDTATVINPSSTYTLSAFVKKGSVQYVVLSGTNSSGVNEAGAVFDLDAVTATVVSNVTFTATNASIVSVGNGWYRCSVVVTSTTLTGFFRIGHRITAWSSGAISETYTGNTGNFTYIWGAQLEQRSTVTSYTPTTTQPITNYIPVLQTAAANVARFDHNPVTRESLGLLVEEQRTNLLTYSEQFDNAAWTKTGSTITANTIVAPDGTLTGDALIESATLNNHFVTQAVSKAASAITYTATVYVKTLNGRQFRLTLGTSNRSNGANIDLDLTTGVATTATVFGTGWTSPSGSITSVGNGWYRVSLTVTSNTDTSISMFAYAYNGTTQFYTGDGYSGVYIWGAQLEAGSFPTSYIATSASQVTRAADSASITGSNFTSWYRADEGTMYAEGVPVNASTRYIMSISDGTSSNRNGVYWNSSGTAQATVVGGTTQSNLTATAGAIGVSTKMAVSYKVNNFVFTSNGVTASTDTSGLIPQSQTTMDIGASVANAGNWNSTIKKIAFYPKASTPTQLVALTQG